MNRTCPHCGAKLPIMVDAFCPECREDLREPAPGNGTGDPVRIPQTTASGSVTLIMIMTVVGMVLAAMRAAKRGDVIEAVYSISLGVIVLIIVPWFVGRSRRPRDIDT